MEKINDQLVNNIPRFSNNSSSNQENNNNTISNAQLKQPEDKGLNKFEKIIFFLFCIILNPIIPGVISFILWRRKSPKKWTDVIKIAKLLILIYISMIIVSIIAPIVLSLFSKP